MTFEDRFWAKVSPEPNSGCWLWTGLCNPKGYGRIMVDGRHQLAHRVSYEMHVGPIQEDLEMDHLCRVRCCVNPAHLEAVTHAENSRRGEAGINQRAKTHCPQGHPYSGENLYTSPNGRRECRTCWRERYAVRRSMKEAASLPQSQ